MTKRNGKSEKSRGRLFYMVAVFFVAVALAIFCGLVAMLLSQLNQAESQIESSIKSTLDSAVQQYDSSIIDTDLLVDYAESLNEDGLAALWGANAASSSQLDELQALLRELQSPIGISLLRPEDAEQLFANDEYAYLLSQFAVDDISALALSAGEDVIYYHTDGSYRVTRVYAITDEVYLLATNLGIVATYDVVGDLLAVDEELEIVYYGASGEVYVYSGDGAVAEAFSYEDFEASDESVLFDFTFEGQSYFCCYSTNNEEEAIIAVFAVDTAAKTQRTFIVFAAIGMLAIVVLCIVAFTLFKRQIYTPVRHLMTRVGADGEGFDELKEIERGIMRLERESESREALVRDAALLYLLQGRDVLAEERGSRGFPFDEEDDCVIVGMQIEPLEREGDESSVRGAQDFEHIVETARHDLKTQLAAAGFSEVRVVDDGLLDVFVVRTTGTEEPTRAIVSACSQVARTFASGQDCSLSLFVSEQVGCGHALKGGYEQVCSLSEHCLAMERFGTVLSYADLDLRPRAADGIDPTMMREFLDAVECLSVERAVSAFDDIVSHLGKDAQQAFDRHGTDMVTLRSLMRLGLAGCPAAHAAGFDWADRLDKRLAAASSIDELRLALTSTMRDIEAAVEREHSDAERFASIERFVRDNIADPNLSGQMVANEFGISPSNVTRIFKKFTNEGFLPYVHGLRIELARGILEQTDKPLEEVAREVGFGNALTMSRAFKKATGMTPGAYREAKRPEREA